MIEYLLAAYVKIQLVETTQQKHSRNFLKIVFDIKLFKFMLFFLQKGNHWRFYWIKLLTKIISIIYADLNFGFKRFHIFSLTMANVVSFQHF